MRRYGKVSPALVATIMAVALTDSPARGADWPQFRGPNASGVSADKQPLPVEFSATERLQWSARLGDGVGSPIVVGGRVYCTAMTGEQRFAVLSFDAATVKEQ